MESAAYLAGNMIGKIILPLILFYAGYKAARYFYFKEHPEKIKNGN